MAQTNRETSSISELIARMQDVAKSSSNVENDQNARASLLQLSRELTTSLEQPDEVVSLVAFSGGRHMCVRVADDLKLFDLLCSKLPRTIDELSQITGAEAGLIARIFRTLVGMGFVRQIDKTHYAATAVSKQMTMPNVRAGVRFFYDQGLEILVHTPAYFRENGYKLPQSMTDGPFQFAHKTDEQCFKFWSKQAGVMENFNVFMQGLFGTPMRLGWTDWFPIEDVCLKGFDESKGSEYVFVDVGGAKGHEAELVLEKFPDTKGKFATQDLGFVINDITDLDPRIERIEHTFTTPQPIKGARVYFLQNIMHNWADGVCETILGHLKDAMTAEYSKVLIGNIILPDQDVPLRNSGLDVAMMYLHSGSQRGESEWRKLIESTGLQVVKVWFPPGDGDGIIEVEKP